MTLQQTLLIFGYLVGAVFSGWTAYQVRYKDRTDLILMGSGPLPGAGLLKTQVASLPAILALICLCSATIIALTGATFASWLLFLCGFVAVAMRRGMLVRAIELHLQASHGDGRYKT